MASCERKVLVQLELFDRENIIIDTYYNHLTQLLNEGYISTLFVDQKNQGFYWSYTVPPNVDLTFPFNEYTIRLGTYIKCIDAYSSSSAENTLLSLNCNSIIIKHTTNISDQQYNEPPNKRQKNDVFNHTPRRMNNNNNNNKCTLKLLDNQIKKMKAVKHHWIEIDTEHDNDDIKLEIIWIKKNLSAKDKYIVRKQLLSILNSFKPFIQAYYNTEFTEPEQRGQLKPTDVIFNYYQCIRCAQRGIFISSSCLCGKCILQLYSQYSLFEKVIQSNTKHLYWVSCVLNDKHQIDFIRKDCMDKFKASKIIVDQSQIVDVLSFPNNPLITPNIINVQYSMIRFMEISPFKDTLNIYFQYISSDNNQELKINSSDNIIESFQQCRPEIKLSESPRVESIVLKYVELQSFNVTSEYLLSSIGKIPKQNYSKDHFQNKPYNLESIMKWNDSQKVILKRGDNQKHIQKLKKREKLHNIYHQISNMKNFTDFNSFPRLFNIPENTTRSDYKIVRETNSILHGDQCYSRNTALAYSNEHNIYIPSNNEKLNVTNIFNGCQLANLWILVQLKIKHDKQYSVNNLTSKQREYLYKYLFGKITSLQELGNLQQCFRASDNNNNNNYAIKIVPVLQGWGETITVPGDISIDDYTYINGHIVFAQMSGAGNKCSRSICVYSVATTDTIIDFIAPTVISKAMLSLAFEFNSNHLVQDHSFSGHLMYSTVSRKCMKEWKEYNDQLNHAVSFWSPRWNQEKEWQKELDVKMENKLKEYDEMRREMKKKKKKKKKKNKITITYTYTYSLFRIHKAPDLNYVNCACTHLFDDQSPQYQNKEMEFPPDPTQQCCISSIHYQGLWLKQIATDMTNQTKVKYYICVHCALNCVDWVEET